VTAGQLIRQARLIAGLTQQQLGERVGKAAPHIARWERDAVDPGFETVRTLLRACGVDLSMELVAYDISGDAELEHNLRLTAAERLDQAEAELRRLARLPERAARVGVDAAELKWFRPVELFAILEQSRLEYVTIGAFGALLHGSGVLSDNIDIVPSTRPANLERLRQAYIALNARTPKNKQLRLDPGEQPKALTRMLTRSGPLNIILSPAGTSGYDDLRRKAVREPLGFGVRTMLASLDDIIRTTTAHGGKNAEVRLPRLHRLLDLAQTIGPDPDKFPLSDPRHPTSAGADDD
jgi:transcriptional regulator with XRE-family HTH domain